MNLYIISDTAAMIYMPKLRDETCNSVGVQLVAAATLAEVQAICRPWPKLGVNTLRATPVNAPDSVRYPSFVLPQGAFALHLRLIEVFGDPP